MAAFEGPMFVIVIFTLPDMFQAKYTPLLKFDIDRVSSWTPLFASIMVTVSALPCMSQSNAYMANRCVPVMVRLRVKLVALNHVDAIPGAPGTARARGSCVAGFHV